MVSRMAAPIPGATNLTYTIASAALTNNGALFDLVAANVVSNVSYSVTSSVVTLTVIRTPTRRCSWALSPWG